MEHIELLWKINERVTQLRDSHNTSYVTFIGLVITTIGVFLGLQEVNCFTKYAFLWSVVFFVAGFLFYFQDSSTNLKKTENMYPIVARHSDNHTDASKDLDMNQQLSSDERDIRKLIPWLFNIGMILFLIGIVSFIFLGE